MKIFFFFFFFFPSNLNSFISASRSTEYPSAFLSGAISSSTKISSFERRLKKREKEKGEEGEEIETWRRAKNRFLK